MLTRLRSSTPAATRPTDSVQPTATVQPTGEAELAARSTSGAGPASWLVRRRRRVLAAVLLGLVALFVVRSVAGGELSGGGAVPPGSESQRAGDVLAERFGVVPSGLVLVVTAEAGDVDAPAAAAAASELVTRLTAEPGVTSVVSYWQAGSDSSAAERAASLRSSDGRHALVLATLAGDEPTRAERAGELAAELRGTTGPVTVGVTGTDVVADETTGRISDDLLRAEVVAFPVMMLLLGLFLRRARLALVPVAVGLLVVAGSVGVVGLVAAVTTMSTFTTNIVVGLGLGLSIDYSLLLIARYREELSRARPTGTLGTAGTAGRVRAEYRDAALSRAVSAVARTIGFSAATVAISLFGLALFPIPFLRSMAYAGVVATVLAAVFSLLAVPALVAGLGDRVLPRRARQRPVVAHADEVGFWYRCATVVMRRPVIWAASVLVGLVVLAVPLGRMSLGVNDDRNLPTSSESRQAAEILRSGFDGRESSPLRVVAADVPDGADAAAVASYTAALSAVDGVARVDVQRAPGGDGVFWSVVGAVEPISAAGERLVADLRAVPAPFPTDVGGAAADYVDTNDALLSRMPWAAAFIALVTFLALFAMFGSVVVPVQALAVNALSLSATFGVLVWIFQDGNLADLFGFTATGSIPAAMPVLIFCVAFGVSMDYGVFLLARVKEEHDRTGDPVGSVLTGMHRTGSIVTFAALLLATVFGGFVTSSVTAIKLLGFGLTLAVLLDAYVVRGVLVPALLKLGGSVTWWAPGPLRRLHDRFGLRGH